MQRKIQKALNAVCGKKIEWKPKRQRVVDSVAELRQTRKAARKFGMVIKSNNKDENPKEYPEEDYEEDSREALEECGLEVPKKCPIEMEDPNKNEFDLQ